MLNSWADRKGYSLRVNACVRAVASCRTCTGTAGKSTNSHVWTVYLAHNSPFPSGRSYCPTSMPRSSFLTVRASRARFRFPCYYCPFAALSERGRTQHVDRTPACREKRDAEEKRSAAAGQMDLNTMDMDVDSKSTESEARYVESVAVFK